MPDGLIAFTGFNADLPRKDFDCGNELLNEWFATQAGQQERRHNVRTHLGLATFDSCIASFFTLITHEIGLDEIAMSGTYSGRKYPVPAMLIAQLAVDLRYQGTGVGKLTLAHALLTLARTSAAVGFEAVVVDAIDDRARTFYAGFGFEPLVDSGDRLVLPTRELLRNFEAPQE